MSEQLALTDPTWPCPVCGASGVETDPETGVERRCRMCLGARYLAFDPDDRSEIAF